MSRSCFQRIKLYDGQSESTFMGTKRKRPMPGMDEYRLKKNKIFWNQNQYINYNMRHFRNKIIKKASHSFKNTSTLD